MLILDGGQGEGGGQIVRTALTLSCILGIPFRVRRIRAGREPSGLRPQHVAAIRAATDICGAHVEGAEVGSETLTFEPGGSVRAGTYDWEIGTAGAATLVLQTVLLPLALAKSESSVSVRGGTHVPHSPSAHYLRDVYVPLLLEMGADAALFIEAYGWMPEGGGQIDAQIAGSARLVGRDLRNRGELERVFGAAVASSLPSHIPQRMANRAINLIDSVESFDAPVDIRPLRTSGISAGAGIFLTAEYGNGRGGWGVLGHKGMPSEVVAGDAVTALLSFHDSGAAVDRHLADQLVIPLALAAGESAFTTPEITQHLRTNIETVQHFVDRAIRIDEARHLVSFA
ncbi:RNA 3'-terminal phosphate cyclase [Aggregatilinea lenta]|uniref:RNA 3'-terminal phosphate cyclase n=1 Tax=Aggregatilinea lenta TaxID=913108 RepID=UPI0013C344F6|nr:RNA 3'-terminal phosphate cyclase [Aggregatilinea lenta]